MPERKWKLPDDLPLRHSCETAIGAARKKDCDHALITVDAVTIRRLLAHADRQAERIKELEAQVKLADRLINGEDDHWGMAHCIDGYYGECFTEDLQEWDRLMERGGDDE